jgi:hypothetical protein
MKNVVLPIFLLLLAFSSATLWAGEPPLLPDLAADSGLVTEQETSAPLPPHSDLYSDFTGRLEAAIENRNLVAIQALYQTNGVGAGEFKIELARWQRVLDKSAKPGVSTYFKELGTLPPQAHKIWEEQARRLTKHEVTHLVFVRSGTGVGLVLPLVVVGDELLIVPSEKRNTESCCPANGSQPIRSETNRTPGAAAPADKK